MGRHYHYRPGDFYRQDDRTGFPQYASRTRQQWNRLIVDESVWEPRQPQDLVRGVRDNQTVGDARPLAPNTFIGNPVYVQMSQAAGVGATDIYVQYIAGLTPGDKVGVMMDNGVEFTTALVSIDPSGEFITIAAPLPYFAAAGNLVCSYRIPA